MLDKRYVFDLGQKFLDSVSCSTDTSFGRTPKGEVSPILGFGRGTECSGGLHDNPETSLQLENFFQEGDFRNTLKWEEWLMRYGE